MQGLYRRGMAGIALLAGIVLCLVSPASAGYTFTTIDNPGGYNSQAYGINNSGDIVGSYSDAGGTLYGFLDVGGIFTLIYISGASITQAIGINDSGNIVGSFLNGYTYWGFLDVGGSFTVIDSGAFVTFGAFGINSSGEIVGYYGDVDGYFHGFLDVGGSFTAIDFPGAIHTQAYGINDSGEIVGFYNSGDGTRHGFLDTGATFTTIDFPGGSNSQAYGINDSGDIVGFYADAKRVHHGFLDVGGSFVTIDFPGARETFASGINNARQIVGQYTDTHGTHGFLATPSSSATVLTPADPGGPSSGITGTSYTYSTGGSVSSLGNLVEYQFDWKGDGSDLSAFGSATQSKTWMVAGTYTVRARGRDSVDTLAVSNWSSGLPVTISRDPNAPSISITPTSYPFGNVKVKRSKAVSFIVKNSGTISYTISTSITGADASIFKITSGSGSRTIKPSKTLTIKVTFKPASTGAKTSTLEITSNDPNASTIDIPLSGTGQ